MSLQYNQETSELTFNDKKVGECHYDGNTAKISLNLTYECRTEDWITPLSWFCYALRRIVNQNDGGRVISLELPCSEDDIQETYDVARFLPEKTIKQEGYIWRFHKTDSDEWPSVLHGHDYANGLTLDALSGNIYDAVTRTCCKRLKKRSLMAIHEKLRNSSDFCDKMELHVASP